MEGLSEWVIYDHETEVAVAAMEILLIFTVLAFRLWPQRDFVKGLALELLRSIIPSRDKPANESPVERRVREECKRLHLLRAELFLIGQNIGYLVQSCVHLLNITTSTPTFSHVTVAWAVILFTGNALFAVSPRCITPRTVDIIYCYNIVLWCIFLLLQERDSVHMHNARVNLMSVALYLGFLDLKPWLNILGILAFASTETAMLALSGDVWMSTWAPYLTLLFVLLGAHMLFKRGVRLMILGRDFENELAAAKTLLSSICDVTLQLDAGLRLKEHSPRLADILFHGSGRSYEGVDLRELMAGEEDRKIFTDHMSVSSQEALARAEVFHARMRDGTGAPVAMEFFSVAFRGQDAHLHRCLGVREYTDIAPVVRAPPPPPAVEVKMPKPRPTPAMVGTPAEHLQADLRSHASSRSSASSAGRDGSQRAPRARGASRGGASRKRAGVARETVDMAKGASIVFALRSWWLPPAAGACCPKHTAVAALRRLLPRLEAADCTPGFAPLTKWQCSTCGICDSDWRISDGHNRCSLCEAWSEAEVMEAAPKLQPKMAI